MKKRNIFMLIICFGTILEILFHDFLFNDIPGVFSFLFLVPFYIIVYLYYNRHKFIRYMSFLGIFNVLSNAFLAYYIILLGFYDRKVILIARTSTFGSIIMFLLLFIMLLQDKPKNKAIRYSFIFIIITSFLFHSYYKYILAVLLTGIFGPDSSAISTTIYVVDVIAIISKILIMMCQVLIIYKLDRSDEVFLNQKRI